MHGGKQSRVVHELITVFALMDGSEGYQEGTKQAESGKIQNYGLKQKMVQQIDSNTCKLAVVGDCKLAL